MDSQSPNPLFLALPRLVSSFLNLAFVLVVLPIIVLHFAPDEAKGIHLGTIVGLCVLLSIAVLLAVAASSDALRGTRPRRKPFVIGGHALVLPAALVLACFRSYPLLVLAVLLMVAARSAIDSAHGPLLRELVAEERRGRYSAYVAVCQVAGTAGGAAIAGYLAQEAERSAAPLEFLTAMAALAPALALAGALVFCFGVREPPSGSRPSSILGILNLGRGERERRYLRFIIVRTIFLAGIFSVLVFYVYIVRDVLRAPDYKMAAGIYFAAAALGSAVFAVSLGRLSDRLGCVPMMYACGVMLSAACMVLFFVGPLLEPMAYAAAILFGGAFGGMFAASLALSTKLIPRADDTAKYMALLMISTYVAQLVASVIGGAALDLFNRMHAGSGYLAIFVLAHIAFLGGGWVLTGLKEPEAVRTAN